MNYLDGVKHRLLMKRLASRQGWKEEFGGSFVFGNRIYLPSGSVLQQFERTNPGFEIKGSAAEWAKSTGILDKPELAAHAFTLLLGFAAPLIQFTGIGGVLASPYGPTGVGKSIMTKWMMSIWGNPDELYLHSGSNTFTMFQTYGRHCNLPILLEGALDDAKTSDIFKITNDFERGSGKAMGQGVEDLPPEHWSSILVIPAKNSTTNLSGYTVNKMRDMTPIFDYELPMVPEMAYNWLFIKQRSEANCGAAGDVFVQNIVRTNEKLRDAIAYHETLIREQCGVDPKYRNLIALAACVYAAGYCANTLGLVKFDMQPIHDFAIKQIKKIAMLHKKSPRTVKSGHTLAGRVRISEAKKKFFKDHPEAKLNLGRKKKTTA